MFVWYLLIFFLTFLGKSVIDDLILRDIFLRFVFRTDEKLRQLIQDKETQELQKALEESPVVNSSQHWRASLRNNSTWTTILGIKDNTMA